MTFTIDDVGTVPQADGSFKELSLEEKQALVDQWNANLIKPFEKIVAEFEAGVQSHLDGEAQAKGYDNIISACSYAAAPNPFQAEAVSFVTWRGDVWAYCYQELAKVQAGTRPMPTIEQIIAELPVRDFS